VDASPSAELVVVCGPMFSGKTEALLEEQRLLRASNASHVLVKPSRDSRSGRGYVATHSGRRARAIEAEDAFAVHGVASSRTAVLVDEGHFFEPALAGVLAAMRADGRRVVVAGLDLDFRGRPFATTEALLEIADRVRVLVATCGRCGREATMTQRLVGDRPADFDAEVLVPGGAELYSPRCERCFWEEREHVD